MGTCNQSAYNNWTNRILNSGQQIGITNGVYIQAMSDFFYQMMLPTGQLIPDSIEFHTCLCRNSQVDSSFDNVVKRKATLNNGWLDDGIPVSNLANFSGYEFVSIGRPELLQNRSYYLCPNCLSWRNLLNSRLRTLVQEGAQHILFDVDNTPEGGCFCAYCRTLFANLNCGGDALCRYNFDDPQENIQLSYLHGFNEEFNLNIYPQYLRRLVDLNHITLMTHFDTIQHTLHTSSVGGTLAVVSTAEFPGLVSDHHRCAFINSLDMLKGEWTMPIKLGNNETFWGDAATMPNTRVPENIRLLGAMSLYRDVSKYRLPRVWIAFDWRSRESTQPSETELRKAITIDNNRRIRTWLGMAYVAGVVTSTSIANFAKQYDNCSDCSNPPCYRLSDSDLLALNPNLSVYSSANCSVIQLDSITKSVCTPVFDLDAKMSALLANKRPYRWGIVEFNETNRNNHMYDSTVIDRKLRLKATWQNELLPLYSAYEALANYAEQNTSIKYPVGFIYAGQTLPVSARFVVRAGPIQQPAMAGPRQHIFYMPSHNESQNNYFRIGEPNLLGQSNLFSQMTRELEVEPSPFYLHDSTDHNQVYATFYTGANVRYEVPALENALSVLTVPIVIDPVQSIPRRSYFEVELIRLSADTIQFNGFVFKLSVGDTLTLFENVSDTVWVKRLNTHLFSVYNLNSADTTSIGNNSTYFDTVDISRKFYLWRSANFDPHPIHSQADIAPLKSVISGKLALYIRKSALSACAQQLYAYQHNSDPALTVIPLTIEDQGTLWKIPIEGFDAFTVIDVVTNATSLCDHPIEAEILRP